MTDTVGGDRYTVHEVDNSGVEDESNKQKIEPLLDYADIPVPSDDEDLQVDAGGLAMKAHNCQVAMGAHDEKGYQGSGCVGKRGDLLQGRDYLKYMVIVLQHFRVRCKHLVNALLRVMAYLCGVVSALANLFFWIHTCLLPTLLGLSEALLQAALGSTKRALVKVFKAAARWLDDAGEPSGLFQAKQDIEAMKRESNKQEIEVNGGLENYCSAMRNTLQEEKPRDMVEGDDQDKIEKVEQETLDWPDKNQLVGKDEFEVNMKGPLDDEEPVDEKEPQISGNARAPAPTFALDAMDQEECPVQGDAEAIYGLDWNGAPIPRADISIGATVRIVNLTSMAGQQLNGSLGTVVSNSGLGRLGVKLLDGHLESIQPENLLVACGVDGLAGNYTTTEEEIKQGIEPMQDESSKQDIAANNGSGNNDPIDTSGFIVDDLVRLVGLRAKPDWNGAIGELSRFDPRTGRWQVAVGPKVICVKPVNIELYYGSDSEGGSDSIEQQASGEPMDADDPDITKDISTHSARDGKEKPSYTTSHFDKETNDYVRRLEARTAHRLQAMKMATATTADSYSNNRAFTSSSDQIERLIGGLKAAGCDLPKGWEGKIA